MQNDKSETKKQLTRKDIPEAYTWDTSSVYADMVAWELDFMEVKTLAADAVAFKGRLNEGAETLRSFLEARDRLSIVLGKVSLFSHLKNDEDNASDEYQQMEGRVAALTSEVRVAMSFFLPELLGLSGEQTETYLSSEVLAGYKKDLEDILRYRPHTLDAASEELLALSSEMAYTAGDVFEMFVSADLEFDLIKDSEGEKVRLTHGNYIRFMESDERMIRRQAFKSLYGTYAHYKNTLAATLYGAVKRDVFYARARSYNDALEAALFADNISRGVYERLIETISEELPAFWRYLDIKKRVLGLGNLRMYDVYAPLIAECQTHIPYDEGCAMVIAALAPLGEEYISILNRAFEERWIDVYETKHKTAGAYSSGVYGEKPFILLNWQNDLNSVSTLAHELGHSVHSYLSWHNQPYTYGYYSIFVAEVASTVNEILLCGYLLRTAAGDAVRLNVINRFLEGFRGTVFRQTMFAEFEKIMHERVEAAEPLTAGALSDIYLALNRKYFGEGTVTDEEIGLEWARIPHFYNNFYVYKYATGFSAAAAIASAILKGGEEGREAVSRYLRFLSAGGSDDPLSLLKKAGVDMESPEPIKQAVGEFRRMLDEFESLYKTYREKAFGAWGGQK